jgi:predicted GNAT family acetyltransferase
MEYRISLAPDELQLEVIHGYLTRSYWAQGISRDLVERAVINSICAGAFAGDAQIGFARVVSDRATFAYLADVFVLEDHRGRGTARAMLAALDAHPALQGLRRWVLFTRDMQPVYAKQGWTPYPHPERLMVRDIPDLYTR